MAMNLLHRRRCSSTGWARDRGRLSCCPGCWSDVELGSADTGNRPGLRCDATRALLDWADSLTAVEVDQRRWPIDLHRRYGDRARIIHGDGTNTGLPDDHFSFGGVLHDAAPRPRARRLQDRLFGEAFRVLRPGGAFAGSDGVPVTDRSGSSHVADTYNPVRTGGPGQAARETLDSSMSRSKCRVVGSGGVPPSRPAALALYAQAPTVVGAGADFACLRCRSMVAKYQASGEREAGEKTRRGRTATADGCPRR